MQVLIPSESFLEQVRGINISSKPSLHELFYAWWGHFWTCCKKNHIAWINPRHLYSLKSIISPLYKPFWIYDLQNVEKAALNFRVSTWVFQILELSIKMSNWMLPAWQYLCAVNRLVACIGCSRNTEKLIIESRVIIFFIISSMLPTCLCKVLN